MTQSINEIERDIEQSRAHLDLTIDRIQDRLAASGMVEDVLGSGRKNRYTDVFDNAIAVIRRNPVPVLLVAAGVGWLLYRISQSPVQGTRPVGEALLKPGRTRAYDAGPSAPVPGNDTLEGGVR